MLEFAQEKLVSLRDLLKRGANHLELLNYFQSSGSIKLPKIKRLRDMRFSEFPCVITNMEA